MAVPSLLDFVCMTVASAPGTETTITFGSVATSAGLGGGILPISAVAVNGQPYSYLISDGNNRELCWGVYNSGAGTITRVTRIATVNGTVQTTPINASSSAIISGIAAAEDIVTPASMYGGMINKFRNPGFDVAQRGTSGTLPSATLQYTLDGWMLEPLGASLSWSQEFCANIPGNALRFNAASGLISVNVAQSIESSIAAQLLSSTNTPQNVTVQFLIYNGTSSELTPQLGTFYANSRDVFSSKTFDLDYVSLQAIPANSIGVVAYTFLPSTKSIANGYQILLRFTSGLNSTGYVDIGQADIRVAAPSVPLGLNSYAPPPEIRPINVELPLNQRYFYGFAPGAANAALGIAFPVQVNNTLSISDELGISNGLGINDTLGLDNTMGVDNTISLDVDDLELATESAEGPPAGGCCGFSSIQSVKGYTNNSLIPPQPLSGGVSLTGGVTLDGSVALTGSIALTGSVSLSGNVTLSSGYLALRLPVRMRVAPTGITVSGMNTSLSFYQSSFDEVLLTAGAVGPISTASTSDYIYVTGSEL